MKGNLESKRLNAHFKMQTASNGFKLSPFKQFKSHVKHQGRFILMSITLTL